MRMPVFSYFVVMGLTITLALIYISDRIEPLGSPVPTSQIVGIAKPFKPEPERSPYTITGTNFAAAYKPASARAAEHDRRIFGGVERQPAGLTRSSSNSRWQVLKHTAFPAGSTSRKIQSLRSCGSTERHNQSDRFDHAGLMQCQGTCSGMQHCHADIQWRTESDG